MPLNPQMRPSESLNFNLKETHRIRKQLLGMKPFPRDTLPPFSPRETKSSSKNRSNILNAVPLLRSHLDPEELELLHQTAGNRFEPCRSCFQRSNSDQ
ncbi:hypothetical protein DR999_PMT14439 [Platysternon megacephalum]|uniref:Uncharacterized protein n=1 Tax=Platysternon megacephalum TaxID=55544 RepID=A0A4D9E444_9SAUR|nr:hypothetical protein DR999_PMT14439 [Platysternon megacephalum]